MAKPRLATLHNYKNNSFVISFELFPFKKIIAVGLVLLLSLSVTIPATLAVTAPDVVKWSRVNIPAEGRLGNWVLARGSDIQYLAMAIDGTLYAYVKGLPYTLYKSTDSGYSWSDTGNVTDAIVALTTAADDASVIYYATLAKVYKSTDAGKSFLPLAANPGGAGGNNIEITSIDIARWGDSYIIVVGTRDADAGEYGGVYILNEEQLFPSWLDTNIGSYDVYAVAFSPCFAWDKQIVAVVTDEADSFVTTNFGAAIWGKTIGDARLAQDNSGASLAVSISADIAFPDDYSSDPATGPYVQFVAINAGGGNGDIYMIYGVKAPSSSVAIDLNVGSGYGLSNIDATSLAISGNATTAHLLAGAAASGQVYYSSDSGANWARSLKEPTGFEITIDGVTYYPNTYVVMAPDFVSSGRAYAATSGSESAFSLTLDGGVTWNQLGLIDTGISSIVDLALSPSYSQDNALFMLTTWDGEHSLWRSLNGGTMWERILTRTLANAYAFDLVELSPRYDDSRVVFIAGSSNGKPAIWKSADNGQSFICRNAPLPIDAWAVVDDTTLFIGSHDGINGLVYKTSNSGLSYYAGVVAGTQSLASIALSPNYDHDGIVLVGNSNGWVFWSNNNGASFEPLPPGATSKPLSGEITIAFDPQFSSNKTIYAASDTANKGIYRFIIGTSTKWESIDSTLPAGGMIGKLAVSADGTLYAANFQPVDTVNEKGGMERSLNPTYSQGATFETVTRGLDDGATLSGLWLHGNQLWSIDTANIKLMTYSDSLTRPVVLTSPVNQAPGVGTIISGTISDVSLDWEPLSGATSYQWQLDDDNNFSSEGNTSSTSVRLPDLKPATTYYWRVRAIGPVLSPWSARWSFTTSLGGEIVAPKLESPQAGASGVSVRPVFQWSAVAGADGYELVVSIHFNFDNPSIAKVGEYALPGNAWQSDVSLNYATTYYWKVRAVSSDSSSAWSAVGAFTTEPEPLVVAEPPPTPTIILPAPEVTVVPPELIVVPPPGITVESSDVTVELPTPTQPLLIPPQPSQATPDWVFYMMGFMGLIIVLLLVTILVIVVIRR